MWRAASKPAPRATRPVHDSDVLNTSSVYTGHGTSTYTYTTYVPMVYSHTCKFRVFLAHRDAVGRGGVHSIAYNLAM